jgi:hypothetical protein
MDDIRGVVSVELDAIVTDASISCLVTVIFFLHAALELQPVTMANVESRNLPGPFVGVGLRVVDG